MNSPIQFQSKESLQTHLENHILLNGNTVAIKKIIESVSKIFADSKKCRDTIGPRVLLHLYDFRNDFSDKKLLDIANLLAQALLDYEKCPHSRL